MKLTIDDLKEVLKVRTSRLTGKKPVTELGDIVVAIYDIRSALDEIETRVEEAIALQDEERRALEENTNENT